MRTYIRQLRASLVVLATMTLLTGLIYPAIVTVIGQVGFNRAANGSLVSKSGKVVGSTLLGQPFSAPQYFAPRPSLAGTGYDGSASGSSNLGVNDPRLLATITARAAAYRSANGLAADAPIPSDAVTASSSGLDPHISKANALVQAARVARVRSIPLQTVETLINKATDRSSVISLSESGVNVLRLNLSLDAYKSSTP